jgi:hypothetical protein
MVPQLSVAGEFTAEIAEFAAFFFRILSGLSGLCG